MGKVGSSLAGGTFGLSFTSRQRIQPKKKKVVNRMGTISKLAGVRNFEEPDLGPGAYALPEKRRLGSVPRYDGELTDADMAMASGNAN